MNDISPELARLAEIIGRALAGDEAARTAVLAALAEILPSQEGK